ncbi:MAG: helix-hairpin-helix domain-containing protein [Gammaproteobacteria bacterium]|jgi:competence protein ComEA
MKKLKYLLGAATLLLSLSTLAGEPVDLNSANAKALATAIDGVGMKRAEAIVNYRNQHGPFESVDDLAKVRGISTKTINKNRENLSVNLSDG